MTDNPRAVIGGNAPPEEITDPLLQIQAKHDETFAEVANWLDGSKVETLAQMEACDKLLAEVKAAKKEAEDAKEVEYRPHKTACDAVVARWKLFLADLDRQANGLVAAVDEFKRAEAARKEAERKAAERKAWEETEAAKALAQSSVASDLEAQREVAAAAERAKEAQRVATAAKRNTVKGLRTVTTYHVIDARELARYLWEHDRAAMDEYMAARGRALGLDLPGVFEQRKEKAAY